MSIDIKDQVIKNSFWNVVGTLINRIGSLILIILLSRLLMPEGFGRYSLAMTIALFFISFSDMGINQTLIRYVALGINKKNNESMGYFRYLFKIKFFISLLLSLLLFLIAYPLSFYIFNDPDLFALLIILSFYVIIISLEGFFESLFFIKKNVKFISIKESILVLMKISSIFLIGYFISSEFHLISVFLSFVIISLLIFFVVFYFSKNYYPYLFKKTNAVINKTEIKKFILFLNIQNTSLLILFQMSIILLGIFLAEQYVGYYNASWVLVLSISNLFSLSYVLLPILSNMKEKKFQNSIKKIFNLFFILTIPISFGLSILSRYFIVAIYGGVYLPAWISLSILSFLIPFIVSVDLSIVSFSARNKQKKFSIIMLISVLIFFILNYTFINLFSVISDEAVLIGVSVANLITWLFCFISSVFFLKKEFNVKVLSFKLIKPILSSLIMSSSILILLNYFGEMNLFKGIVIILFGAFVYLASLFLIKGIEKEEIREILKILFKFNKKNNIN